jgi:anaphase-promoting complex subunit 1
VTAWPEFHNGVAAALRLALERSAQLTRAWIVYNQPPVPTYSNAGVLLALGLTGGRAPAATCRCCRSPACLCLAGNPACLLHPRATPTPPLPAGHLDRLATPDLYRYLSFEHDATRIGLLLGMAAAKRASMDPRTSTSLFMHVPNRHPQHFPEIELASHVQVGGVGGGVGRVRGRCFCRRG